MWGTELSRRLGLAALLIMAMGGSNGAAASADRELVIFNWSEYMDSALIAEFERRHDVDITEVYYQGDDHRDDLMVETNGEGFDLILVSGVMVEAYRRHGWIAAIDKSAIPNLRHLEPRWRRAFAGTRDYGVPFSWGTVGIAYRRDLVSEPITSWRQIYQPDEPLRGRLLMPDASRDVLGMALKSLGHSANSTDSEALREAAKLAMEQRPYLAAYNYPALNEDSSLVTGAVVAALVYGGDALNIAENHPKVTYVLPREGGNIWVDYLTISANSARKEFAHRFINFLNDPEIAARQAQYMFTASPNHAARSHLPEAFLDNPVIYPDAAALANSEFYTPLSPEALRQRNALFARITQ